MADSGLEVYYEEEPLRIAYGTLIFIPPEILSEEVTVQREISTNSETLDETDLYESAKCSTLLYIMDAVFELTRDVSIQRDIFCLSVS